ncbi:hypothetical protein GCM10010528_12940 [Gordonia defluvii]|uniref:Uncharacterized protein n=1 Tax=Gordonia defluvii TaxID=283718 RepID=A0ABP6L8H2_9ACTN
MQPGGAGDIVALFADLHDAAADDLLDELGVDPCALDDAALGRTEDLGGVQAGQPAVALADRRPRRLYDYRDTHGDSYFRLLRDFRLKTRTSSCSMSMPVAE